MPRESPNSRKVTKVFVPLGRRARHHKWAVKILTTIGLVSAVTISAVTGGAAGAGAETAPAVPSVTSALVNAPGLSAVGQQLVCTGAVIAAVVVGGVLLVAGGAVLVAMSPEFQQLTGAGNG